MSDLIALDIIVILIIAISTLMSLVRGFTREVLSLASWVIAAYAALFGGPLVVSFITQYIQVAWLASTIAYGSVFVITLVMSSLLANRFANSLQNSSIGALDRTLGVIFGALRGGLIISLAYLLLLIILPRNEQPSWLTQARLYPLIQTGSAVVLSLIPEKGIPVDIDKLKNVIDRSVPKISPDLIDAGKAIDLNNLKNLNKGTDKPESKGYSNSDRAVLDSLIKGTQKVE